MALEDAGGAGELRQDGVVGFVGVGRELGSEFDGEVNSVFVGAD